MSDTSEKARRMRLRLENGTRPWPEPFKSTNGRGPVYRTAHACFDCRRSFKLEDDPSHNSPRNCPGCGHPLRWMGRTFAAPKKTDLDQWKKVKLLWDAGFRFGSYRTFPDAEPLPASLAEVADFIRRNPDHPMRPRHRLP